ncbi:MAG: hypothetical protein M3N52_05370, partial [Actinomycetota bacterium]|nr:hypothetical protein [Actinomycetota bacterium]
ILGRGHLIPHTRGRHTNLAQPALDDGTPPLAPAPRLTNPQPDIATLDTALETVALRAGIAGLSRA